MTAVEYSQWILRGTDASAADLAGPAGSTVDEARRRAETQLAPLLPDGLDTIGTFLLRVLDGEGAPVGVL